MSNKKQIEELLKIVVARQNGVLFVEPCVVHRGTYAGRSLLTKNSNPEEADERGYFAVERWILSKTVAENEKPKKNEGLSLAILEHQDRINLVLFTDLVEIAEKFLLGEYSTSWPLTKILDIGGKPVKPSFSDGKEEIPPIPAHIHSGYIVDGKVVGPGKKRGLFLSTFECGTLSSKA